MGVDAASGATLEHFLNPVAVVVRAAAAPPAPPSGFTPTVDAGGALAPELSEADRTMLMRN